MQAKAKLSYLRISPRKVRLVADVVRGLDANEAEKKLSFINKKAARPILKLLQSCIANAENNFKLKKDNLFIKEIRVDEGPTLKRWMPRAMGRASAINKRTSHINIVLDERVESTKVDHAPRKEKKKDKKEDKNVKIIKDIEEVKEKSLEERQKKDSNFADKEKQQGLKKKQKSEKGSIKNIFRRKSI